MTLQATALSGAVLLGVMSFSAQAEIGKVPILDSDKRIYSNNDYYQPVIHFPGKTVFADKFMVKPDGTLAWRDPQSNHIYSISSQKGKLILNGKELTMKTHRELLRQVGRFLVERKSDNAVAEEILVKTFGLTELSDESSGTAENPEFFGFTNQLGQPIHALSPAAGRPMATVGRGQKELVKDLLKNPDGWNAQCEKEKCTYSKGTDSVEVAHGSALEFLLSPPEAETRPETKATKPATVSGQPQFIFNTLPSGYCKGCEDLKAKLTAMGIKDYRIVGGGVTEGTTYPGINGKSYWVKDDSGNWVFGPGRLELENLGIKPE